jgi:hypothetical protein
MVHKKNFEMVKDTLLERFFSLFLSLEIVESLAKKVQQFYMKSHITKETISSTVLAFHPVDYREKTLREYKKRIKKYV